MGGWLKSILALVVLAAIAIAVVWLDSLSAMDLQGRARAVDGDSLVLQGERLRLSGIDAPEHDQTCTRGSKSWPCGREATRALRRLVSNGPVECVTQGLDRYERWLARCRIGGIDLAARMVEEGMALSWHGYDEAQAMAKARGAGIWSGEFDIPADWRRERRALGEAATLPGVWVRFRRFSKRWLGSSAPAF